MKTILINCFLLLSFIRAFCQNDNIPRNALVIGNSNYEKFPLKNPVNDANSISETLKELGFEVITVIDANKEEMSRAIRAFGDKLSENPGVGLFYYAGHGIQSKGTNYLVPLKAQIQDEFEIEFECLKASRALSVMEYYSNPFNIVILDACRNNPFRSFSRSTESGLAAPSNPPTGSIISFATQPGKTASDGDGANGLYTQELIKAIKIPNLSIEDVFKKVRINVAKISGQEQLPQEWSSLMGDFYFLKEEVKEKPVEVAVATSPGNTSTIQPSLSENKPKFTIGQSSYLLGNVDLKILFTGDLYIDNEFVAQVNQGSVIPIQDMAIGNHDFKLVSKDKNWSESAMIKENETITLTTTFKIAESASTLSSTTNSTSATMVDTKKIYDFLSVPAQYKKGMPSFYNKISYSVRVPDNYELKEDGESINVIVSFVVLEDGELVDINVLRTSNEVWNNEIMRVIDLTSGNWTPGKINGVSVKQKLTIPINFKI